MPSGREQGTILILPQLTTGYPEPWAVRLRSARAGGGCAGGEGGLGRGLSGGLSGGGSRWRGRGTGSGGKSCEGGRERGDVLRVCRYKSSILLTVRLGTGGQKFTALAHTRARFVFGTQAGSPAVAGRQPRG